MTLPPTLTRRRFLHAAGAASGAVLAAGLPASAPAFTRRRPVLTHGVQSGDVTAHEAIVWARADRPSRMLVEVAPTPSFRRAHRIEGPVLSPDSDLTGKVMLDRLPSGGDVFYRVTLEDLRNPGVRGEPLQGSFRTAAEAPQDVSLVWSGDLAGQGWGDQPRARRLPHLRRDGRARARPLPLQSGDTVYADGPLVEAVELPDGRVWRNVVTDAKRDVAADARRVPRPVRLQPARRATLKRFAARVAQVNQWDDHEVRNNWYPGQLLDDPRYTERRVDVLAARARQAFHEWLPIAPRVADEQGRIYRRIAHGPLLDLFVLDMRTYKDPNGAEPLRRPGSRAARRGPARLAQARAGGVHGDVEGPRPRPPARARRARRRRRVRGRGPGRRRAAARPRARVRRRAGVRAPQRDRAASSCSPPTSTTPRRTATTRPARRPPTSTPFWEFVSGPLNAGAFRPERPRRHVRPRGRVRPRGAARREHLARRTATSSSGTWRSTARAGS